MLSSISTSHVGLSDFGDLLLDLLRAPVQGVNEIPAEVWDLDTSDIAAYLGVIAVTPGKSYIAAPPEEDWKRVVHFLTVVGAEYAYRGRVEECLRQARLAISSEAELVQAFRRAPFYDALSEPARVPWPLPNLMLLEDDYGEGTDAGYPATTSSAV